MTKIAYSLRELADLTKSELVGSPEYSITGVADLVSAGEHDISFLAKPKYAKVRYQHAMEASKAGAVFIAPSVQPIIGRNFLIHPDPTVAFQQVLILFRGQRRSTAFAGIHPTAIIDPSCHLGSGVTVGPYAVIEAGTEIGAKTIVSAHVYIGPSCKIGSECCFHPHVTLREQCLIGDRVRIHSGTVIGSAGFGYATSAEGVHTRLEHLGCVVIEDDVEIGANTTIDRARLAETRIGKGSKLDNLVLIAHNVKIGKHNLIAGHTGIAGSTETGNYVVLAGQVGVDGHLRLADGVILTARSGVSKSLEEAGKYGGAPVQPLSDHNRMQVYERKLASLLPEIEERLKKLESKS